MRKRDFPTLKYFDGRNQDGSKSRKYLEEEAEIASRHASSGAEKENLGE